MIGLPDRQREKHSAVPFDGRGCRRNAVCRGRREEARKQAGLLLRCDLGCERIPMRLIGFCVKRESLLPLVKLLRQTGICCFLQNYCGKRKSAASCNTVVGNWNLLLPAILLRQTGGCFLLEDFCGKPGLAVSCKTIAANGSLLSLAGLFTSDR